MKAQTPNMGDPFASRFENEIFTPSSLILEHGISLDEIKAFFFLWMTADWRRDEKVRWR